MANRLSQGFHSHPLLFFTHDTPFPKSYLTFDHPKGGQNRLGKAQVGVSVTPT